MVLHTMSSSLRRLSESLIFATLIGKLLSHFNFPYYVEHICIGLMATAFPFFCIVSFYLVLCPVCALLSVSVGLMDGPDWMTLC